VHGSLIHSVPGTDVFAEVCLKRDWLFNISVLLLHW